METWLFEWVGRERSFRLAVFRILELVNLLALDYEIHSSYFHVLKLLTWIFVRVIRWLLRAALRAEVQPLSSFRLDWNLTSFFKNFLLSFNYEIDWNCCQVFQIFKFFLRVIFFRSVLIEKV